MHEARDKKIKVLDLAIENFQKIYSGKKTTWSYRVTQILYKEV